MDLKDIMMPLHRGVLKMVPPLAAEDGIPLEHPMKGIKRHRSI